MPRVLHHQPACPLGRQVAARRGAAGQRPPVHPYVRCAAAAAGRAELRRTTGGRRAAHREQHLAVLRNPGTLGVAVGVACKHLRLVSQCAPGGSRARRPCCIHAPLHLNPCAHAQACAPKPGQQPGGRAFWGTLATLLFKCRLRHGLLLLDPPLRRGAAGWAAPPGGRAGGWRSYGASGAAALLELSCSCCAASLCSLQALCSLLRSPRPLCAGQASLGEAGSGQQAAGPDDVSLARQSLPRTCLLARCALLAGSVGGLVDDALVRQVGGGSSKEAREASGCSYRWFPTQLVRQVGRCARQDVVLR